MVVVHGTLTAMAKRQMTIGVIAEKVKRDPAPPTSGQRLVGRVPADAIAQRVQQWSPRRTYPRQHHLGRQRERAGQVDEQEGWARDHLPGPTSSGRQAA